MPGHLNRAGANTDVKVSQSVPLKDHQCHLPEPTFSPAPRFRLRRPNTQAGYFDRISPVLRRVLHACRESRARRRVRHSKRITTVLFASWGWGWSVTFEVKSRFDFSCCCRVWFWFGSRHLKCDTTAILSPPPSSSIRNEFKARTLTFFSPRLKAKVSVPWWYCGTTEVVSGGRPREILDLLCSNAIDASPIFLLNKDVGTNYESRANNTRPIRSVLETALDSNGWLTFVCLFLTKRDHCW